LQLFRRGAVFAREAGITNVQLARKLSCDEKEVRADARDPGGTIYLYAEHLSPNAEPSQNAAAIKGWGDWIPGMINSSGIKGSLAEKEGITRIYRDLGLTMQAAVEGEEAGLYQLWQLLASSKLKVFASLSGFLREYRIGDEQSPLLLCCQSLVLGRNRMRTKAVELPYSDPPPNYDEYAWMA
jgi:hypothetical protein